MWSWVQVQFSSGICSAFVSAEVAEDIRRNPDEHEEIKNTELGRWMIETGKSTFRKGMTFRSEVKPTEHLCVAELKSRAATLKAEPASEPTRRLN